LAGLGPDFAGADEGKACTDEADLEVAPRATRVARGLEFFFVFLDILISIPPSLRPMRWPPAYFPNAWLTPAIGIDSSRRIR
jgi:hypothetical protein